MNELATALNNLDAHSHYWPHRSRNHRGGIDSEFSERDVYDPPNGIPTHEVDCPPVFTWFKNVDLKRISAWDDEEWLSYRLLQANAMVSDCLEINPRKHGGVPVIRGTRFTAAQVLAEIADGRSVFQLCESFDLDKECVTTFIHMVSVFFDRPAPLAAHANVSARRMLE